MGMCWRYHAGIVRIQYRYGNGDIGSNKDDLGQCDQLNG